MKRTLLLVITCVLLINIKSFSQKSDTIRIDASNISTNVLKKGIHQYLVYFRNGKDSSRINYQFWSRIIDFITHEGKEAISVNQIWEDNKSIIHKVYSVCDKKTFAPLYHESWWKGRGESYFDFSKRTAAINKVLLTDADTAKRAKIFMLLTRRH